MSYLHDPDRIADEYARLKDDEFGVDTLDAETAARYAAWAIEDGMGGRDHR